MANQLPENHGLLKNVLDESLDEILSFVTSPEFCKKSWNCVTIPVGKSKPGRKRGIVHVRRTCLNEENIFEIKFHRCKKKICNHEICKKPCSTQIEAPVKDEAADLSKKTKQLTRTKSPLPTKLPKEKEAMGFSTVDIFRNTVEFEHEGTPPAAEASRHRRRSRSKSKDKARQKPSCVLYVYANGSKRKVSFQLNPEMEMFMARTIDKLENFAGVTPSNINRSPEKRENSRNVSDDSELNVKRTLRSSSHEVKKSKKSSEDNKHLSDSTYLSKKETRDSHHEKQLKQESESSRENSPKPLDKEYDKLRLSDKEDSKFPAGPQRESFALQNKRLTNEEASYQHISESDTDHHQNREYRQSENQRTSSSSRKAKSEALSKERLKCSVSNEKSWSGIPVDLSCTTNLEMYPKQDKCMYIKCCKSREEETIPGHTKQSTKISRRDPKTSRVSKTDVILLEKSYKYPKPLTESNEQKVRDVSPLRRDENTMKCNNYNCPGLLRKSKTGDKTPSHENDSDNRLSIKEVSSNKRVSNISKGIENIFDERKPSVRNDDKEWESEKENHLNEGNLSNKYNDNNKEQKKTQIRSSNNSPKNERSYLSRSGLEEGGHKYDENTVVQSNVILEKTSEIPRSSHNSPCQCCDCNKIEPPSDVNKLVTNKDMSVNVGKHVDHINERVSGIYSMENSFTPTMRAMMLEESTNTTSNKNVEPSNESNLRSNLAHYFFICEHGKEHLVTVSPTSSIFGKNPASEIGYKDLDGCCRSSKHNLKCNNNFFKVNDISVVPNEYDVKNEKARPLIHPTIQSKIFGSCMYNSSTPTLQTEDNEHKMLQSPSCEHNQTSQSIILQSDDYLEDKKVAAIKTCKIIASGNEKAFCVEPIAANKYCPVTCIKEHFSDGCKQTKGNLRSDQQKLDKNTSCCNMKHYEGSEQCRTSPRVESPVPGFDNSCITSNHKIYFNRYKKAEPQMSDVSSNQRRCSNCHKYEEKNKNVHNPILPQKFQYNDESHNLHSSWVNKGQYVGEISSLPTPMKTSDITDKISLPRSKDISAMNNYSSLTKSKRTISSNDDFSSSESEEQKRSHYDENKKDISEISNSIFSGDSTGSSVIRKQTVLVNQVDQSNFLQNRQIVPEKNVQQCHRTEALSAFSLSSFELNGGQSTYDFNSYKSTRNNQRNFENDNQIFFSSAENPPLKNTPSSRDYHTVAWKNNYIKPLKEEIFQNELSEPQQLKLQYTGNVQRKTVMNNKGLEDHRPKKACCLPSVNFYVENARDISDVFQTCDSKTDLTTGERTECLGRNRFLKPYDNSPFVGYVHSETHSPFSSDSSYDCHYNKEKLIEKLVSKNIDSRQVNSLHRSHSCLRPDENNLRNIKTSVNFTSETKNQWESHESVVHSYTSTHLLENLAQGKFFEEPEDGLKANNSKVHVQMLQPEFADGSIQNKRGHEFHEKTAIKSFPELDLQICHHNCLNAPFQENNSLKNNNSKSNKTYPFERQTFNGNLLDEMKDIPLNVNNTNPVDVADVQSIQEPRIGINNSVNKNIINVPIAVVHKINEDNGSENDFKYEIISPCGSKVKLFTNPKQDWVTTTNWDKNKLPTINRQRTISNRNSEDGISIDELEGNKPLDILASSSSCLLLDNKSDVSQVSEININANERHKLQMNKFTEIICTNHSRSSSEISIAPSLGTDISQITGRGMKDTPVGEGTQCSSGKKTQAKPYKILSKCSFESNEPNYDNIVLQFNNNKNLPDRMGNTPNTSIWESKKIGNSRFNTSSMNATEFLYKTESGKEYSKKANENNFRNEFRGINKQKSTLESNRPMYKNKILSEKSDNKIFFSMRNKQCKSTYRFQDPLVDPQTGFRPSP